jgi:hypothetical protein
MTKNSDIGECKKKERKKIFSSANNKNANNKKVRIFLGKVLQK